MDDEFLTIIVVAVSAIVLSMALGAAGLIAALMTRARLLRLEGRIAALTAAAAARRASVSTPVAQQPMMPLPVERSSDAPANVQPVPEARADEPHAGATSIPPPVTPPSPLPSPLPGPPPKRLDLETLLTTRVGLWLGAVALMLAAVFLIRAAAEAGWLGPPVRCAMAALLGLVLIGVGLWLRRREPQGSLADQALSAGGVAALLGAAYGAGPLYGLVGSTVGFALLAAAGLSGLLLSLWQGGLVAAVGLAGAYATPLLASVEQPTDLSRLFGYLLVVTAAAFGVVRYRAWAWLGWIATAGGLLYVVLALPALTPDRVWPVALFIPAAAWLQLALLPREAAHTVVGRQLAWINTAVLGVAALALVVTVDDWTTKAGVLLFIPACLAKGAREDRLDRLPWLSALLTLAMLLLWAVPDWQATGEPIFAEGRLMAVLPGAWAPAVLQPLLWTAALSALAQAGAGLVMERMAPRPSRWTALTAFVPVLTLGITYAQVRLFQPDVEWALGAAALAAVLVGLASRVRQRECSAVDAAGAAAALALGCAMVLGTYWLTMALSLFLPALAAIERRVPLVGLRLLALVVAATVLVRLLLNWYVLDYAFGGLPVLNGLLAAYGVPAAAFALAAAWFRRRMDGTLVDDLVVGVSQAGSVAFATVLVVTELHHGLHGGVLASEDASFEEFGWHVCALGTLALAVQRIALRLEMPPVGQRWSVLGWSWRILGGLGLLGAVALLAVNPLLTDAAIGATPLLDALLPAYLLPGILAAVAVVLLPQQRLRPWLAGYAVLAGFVWLTLAIRHVFHPEIGLDQAPIVEAELWAWSGGWLVYGALVLAAGLLWRVTLLRLSALAIIAVATVKVFLIDMAGLGGLWRVLSFLGLGLGLIALGLVYRAFVGAPGGVRNDSSGNSERTASDNSGL